jgi:chromate reductase, NAD(P)H dehydrogenase (quinone)
MTTPLHIVGIAGSLRRGSYNRAALRAAQALAPSVGAEIQIATLDGIPPFNEDELSNLPPAVRALREAVLPADAVLFVTPEYNYSIPGVLKNAIDWCSRPPPASVWRGKPVAIMGVSTGLLGTTRAQYHLRQVLVGVNMFALNTAEVMIGKAAEKFDATGALTDEESRKRILQLLEALVSWTRRLQAGAAALPQG